MAEQDRVTIDIPTSVILKAILIVLFFVFLYTLSNVIVILLFAIIIASAITPFADWLDEKKFPRLLGIMLLYIFFFGLVAFFLSLVIPFITIEINNLIKDLPNFISSVSTSIEQAQQSSRYFNFFDDILNFLDSFSQSIAASSGSVFTFIINIFGGLVSFVAIIVISFYLAYMRNGVENFMRAVVPTRFEPVFLRVWRRSEKKIGRWAQGQLLLALIVGVATYIGLSIIGIKFALILGILAMVFELVPHVGPVLSAIPAVLLAITQGGFGLALWVILMYIIVQQAESHILVPLILGKTLGLNPVVVILALLVGGKLAGIPGFILGVPVAAILVEVLEEFAPKKEVAST